MPEYRITLSDGRVVTLRAPSRPSEEQVRSALSGGDIRHVSGGGGPTMSAQPNTPPPYFNPKLVADEAKNLYNYATKNPERTIEIAGPAAGATLGAGVGSVVPGVGTGIGAVAGATAGYIYGKANRAASNASQGKPLTTGMPQTPRAAAWEPVEAILGNAGPDMALPWLARGLKAAGRDLVASAMHPPISKINDMAEMGRRGTLPMDVRSQGAVNAIELANRNNNWSPVSDANARSLVKELADEGEAVTAGVTAARDAGKTLDYGPITGEAGGYAIHSVRPPGPGGSFTPSDKLPAIRNRIKAYQRDPEASTTKNVWGLETTRTEPLAENVQYTATPGRPLARGLGYETKPTGTAAREFNVSFDYNHSPLPNPVVNPGESILEGIKTKTVPGEDILQGVEFGAKGDGVSLEGVEFNPFSKRVPNDKTDPLDALMKRRYLGGDLRGSYGLNPDNANAMLMDKAMYRGVGEGLRDIAPEIAPHLDREHQLMNLAQMLIPQEYLQSGQKPVNLYTLLGILGQNPAAITLGIGNYPYVMGGMGKALYNRGAGLGEKAPDIANLTRAALARMMAGYQPPE